MTGADRVLTGWAADSASRTLAGFGEAGDDRLLRKGIMTFDRAGDERIGLTE